MFFYFLRAMIELIIEINALIDFVINCNVKSPFKNRLAPLNLLFQEDLAIA